MAPHDAVAHIDNRDGAVTSKVALRRWVADWLDGRGRVLEVFCGQSAVMWALAWRDHCASYVGIDAAQSHIEVRDVRVGDAMEEIAKLDLSAFDCIDVDAWGSPWRVVRAIASVRRLAAGERLGLVITDGSSKRRKFVGHVDDQRWFARDMPGVRTSASCVPVVVAGLRATARLMGARCGGMRRFELGGGGGAKGNVQMSYAAALFEGR